MTNSNVLAGLNILVTRPEPQATELAHFLEQQGAKTWVWPCLEISPSLNPEKIKMAVESLKLNDIVIFVSPNAVNYAFSELNQTQKAKLQQACVVAVGKGTARLLQAQACLSVHFPQKANSEGVLALPVLQELAGKRIIIFRGQSGRELIAKTLQDRGAAVEYVEAYRRQCPQSPAPNFLNTQPFDVVIVTSMESLQNLLSKVEYPQKLLGNSALTVMNEKMLHLATQIGVRRILSIESAENSAILTDLKRFMHE
ncbi:MAG: hemD [Gammaproteobacteria bacterium]|nr:hemD [Gammaproteobacteria bacterium]